MRNTTIIMILMALLLVPQMAFSQTSIQIDGTSSGPIHFNKKVFGWTDQVYITVYAPDFNSDPNMIDVIGLTSDDKVTVSTTGHSIPYQLVETGADTGIFTGYVILTGDPTQKGTTGVDGQGTNPSGIESTCQPVCGPTEGFLPSTGNDGITVSFEYTRDRTVTGSAIIKWNEGNIKWFQSNYLTNSQGVVEIIDPDMNLNPKSVDKFETSIWSDSDTGGIKLAMTETGPDTGIFDGMVYFTTDLKSSGNRLHVTDGDTVTAEYIDRTLPFPHSPSDELRMNATATIGTTVSPLDRAPASNPRILDSNGTSLDRVTAGQQIQIVSEITSNEKNKQPFAYLVQVQDSSGITVSLSWITGSLEPNQILTLGQSWEPKLPGKYTAQIFVWQGIVDPDALSSPLTLQISVV
ncbi:MAG: hypothetical protein ABI340_08680 [Nitrososphaera sp.]